MNKYTILRTIGNGSVGSVYLAKEKKTKTVYAIKKSSTAYYQNSSEITGHMFEIAQKEVAFIRV